MACRLSDDVMGTRAAVVMGTSPRLSVQAGWLAPEPGGVLGGMPGRHSAQQPE